MRRATATNNRRFLAILIIALLGAMAHAAEFGSGAHDHDGVACTFGLGSDDNPVSTGRAYVLQFPAAQVYAVARLQRDANSRFDSLPPPSTGPPS